MSENTTNPANGTLLIGTEVVALQHQPMPVVYFDGAPSVSHVGGVIGVTLTVSGNVPIREGSSLRLVASVAAHLKCNIAAAITLRDALNSALLLAQPIENPDAPKN